MPRGYRSIFAAIAGLALAGGQQPQEDAQRPQGASEASPSAQGILPPAPTATVEPAPKFTPYSEYDPDPCYHSEDHDAADLCAQWRAAIAAEKAANEAARATTWAIVATLLSVLSLLAVAYALLQTNRSLRLAHKSRVDSTRRTIAGAKDTEAALKIARANSNAASKLVKVSDKNAKLELRAYLGVRTASVAHPQIDQPTAYLSVKWCNFGKTPAYNVQIFYEFVFGDRGWRGDWQLIHPEEGHTKVPLAPTGELEIVAAPIDLSEDFVRWCQGERDLFIFAEAFYDDAFGKARRATQRWVLKGDTPGDVALLAEDIGNTAT